MNSCSACTPRQVPSRPCPNTLLFYLPPYSVYTLFSSFGHCCDSSFFRISSFPRSLEERTPFYSSSPNPPVRSRLTKAALLTPSLGHAQWSLPVYLDPYCPTVTHSLVFQFLCPRVFPPSPILDRSPLSLTRILRGRIPFLPPFFISTQTLSFHRDRSMATFRECVRFHCSLSPASPAISCPLSLKARVIVAFSALGNSP